MSFRRFPVRFGKYILLDRVNAGGMAEVYCAKVLGEENFQRLLAIKCMLPTVSADREFVKMFVDEARLASQLAHPNVVHILELGRIESRLYIAMELVNGRDVSNILRAARAARRPLPLQFTAYVIAKAAEGLDYAHHKVGDNRVPLNLIHRDVSPHNILVSYDGEVKVADFGVAKADTRIVHTTGNVLKGKAAYMSPEQICGHELDKRSDVFALGATLFEMLTGERLFRGKGRFEIMGKVRAAQVPSLGPVVPREVEAIARRALARDPGDRFQTVDEMGEALTPFLIEDGVVYGARQAGDLMGCLFAQEVARMAERQKRWVDVHPKHCVGDSSANAVLYQSTFEVASEELEDANSPTTVDNTAPTVLDQTLEQTVAATSRTSVTRDLWLPLGATFIFVVVAGIMWSVSGDPVGSTAEVAGAAEGNRLAAPPPLYESEPTPAAAEGVAIVESPATKTRHGYVQIRAKGTTVARVFIDGQDVGHTPIIRWVRLGTRRLRAVVEGGDGRAQTMEFDVTRRHRRSAPLRLVVNP